MTITDWRRSPPSPSLRLAPSPRGLLNHQHPFRLNCLHQASFIILHLIRSITRSSSPHPHPRSADTHTRRTRTHTHIHTHTLPPSHRRPSIKAGHGRCFIDAAGGAEPHSLTCLADTHLEESHACTHTVATTLSPVTHETRRTHKQTNGWWWWGGDGAFQHM